MSKFYFTYGSEGHPYVGGWTEVLADTEDQAIEVFRVVHPNRNGCLNCAFIYGERFIDTPAYTKGNFGAKCHETLELKITKGEAKHE